MNLLHLLQLTLLLVTVHAKEWTAYSNQYYAVNGCKLSLDKAADFCGKPEGKKFNCICKNKYALTSWMNCGYEYFTEFSKNTIDKEIISFCHSKANSNLTVDDINEIYDKYSSKIVNIDTLDSFNSTSPKFPIEGKAVKKYAVNAYWTYKNRYGNLSTSHYMGIAFVAAVGFVTLCAGILNWLQRFSRSYTNAMVGTIPNGIRKHFILGLLGKHLQSSKVIGGINPDRVEAFFIFLMFLYSILCCSIMGFSYHEGDISFKTYQAGMSRYYGDRSCILLSYQLPLLFIFPGRNNFFQYITRWKYSRFVTFHKWLARIIFLEILIHSFAFSSQTYALHKATRFATDWYREGIVATVSGGFILILASGAIRRYSYEFFFAAHVVLVVMFLWTAWRHAQSQDYEDFYWACCAVWIFDRFVRICRIGTFGGPKTAEIEYFPSENVIKIAIPESKFLKPSPGSHAFIHFLTPLRFWQSHPFTAYPSASQPGYINFTCRVKNGMTKYIAEKCKGNEKNKTSMKVMVDGFYGEQSEYQNFDKTVFITGGTGISGLYYHVKNLLQKDTMQEIKLYWCVRKYEDVKSYLPELMTLKDTKVKPVIYISQPESHYVTTSSDDNEIKDEISMEHFDKDESITELMDFVEIRHNRMCASEIVDFEISEATGTVAFGACAHPEVVDEVRRHIARNLDKSPKRIQYFEEMQQW